MEVVKKDKAGVITVRNPALISCIMQAASILINSDAGVTGSSNCCLVQYAPRVQKHGEPKDMSDLRFYMGEYTTQVLNNKLSEAAYLGSSFCLETLIAKQKQGVSIRFNNNFLYLYNLLCLMTYCYVNGISCAEGIPYERLRLLGVRNLRCVSKFKIYPVQFYHKDPSQYYLVIRENAEGYSVIVSFDRTKSTEYKSFRQFNAVNMCVRGRNTSVLGIQPVRDNGPLSAATKLIMSLYNYSVCNFRIVSKKCIHDNLKGALNCSTWIQIRDSRDERDYYVTWDFI